MPELKASSSTRKSSINSGPFAALFQARRDRKAEKDNIHAREVINAAAGAENSIINELESIDFLHSKLPKEDLELKSNPDRAIGDLEYASRRLIKSLRDNVSTPKADLRPIDGQLLILAQKFKYAVEKGESNAAFAAKAALAMGVDKVRGRVPEKQPDKLKAFIDSSAEYLAHWVTEVNLSSVVDQTQRQADTFRARLETKEGELENLQNELELRIRDDSEFARAFGEVSRDELPENRENWTAEQRDAHGFLVDMNLCEESVGAARQDYDIKELELRICRQRVEDLKGTLAIEPSPDIDDLLNQYGHVMENWFTKLEKIDVAVAEFEKQRIYFEGIREQLEQGEGVTAMRARAGEQARKIQKEQKRRQEAELNEHRKGEADNYDLAGLRDPEKHQEQLEQVDQEREARERSEREREQEAQKQRIRQ